jgi:hypothetical protein
MLSWTCLSEITFWFWFIVVTIGISFINV